MATTDDTARAPESRDSREIAWDEIRDEWRDREFEALHQAVSAVDLAERQAVDELLTAPEAPSKLQARQTLEDAFATTADDGDGRLLLALYVHGRCLEKWEETEDYDRIRLVLDALVAAADGLKPKGSADPQTELVKIVARQANAIKDAMGVEDAMSCSCPVAVGVRARKVVSTLAGVLDDLGENREGARSVVYADAKTTKRYFDTIANVANSVSAYVKRNAPGEIPDFDDALAALGANLEGDGDVYESELRAHRASLEALRGTAVAARLKVEAAEIVYLYPFTLDGIEPEQAVKPACRAHVVRALADIGLPSTAKELDLNDLWDRRTLEPGHDGTQEPDYGGAVVSLPRVTVQTTAGTLLHFKAEVRLSRLGNHHLRIWSRVERGDWFGLHEVNQALRRGSPAMGDERLTSENQTWTKFPKYADAVVDTIAAALSAKKVVHLNAAFHVVLAARSISIQFPDGRSVPDPSPDELANAVGASLLFHPVRHLTTALEEWIRYPRTTPHNLLSEQGYGGDLVVRTHNTTVTHMPASPEWLVDEYEEMIEFVASLPPLFAFWEMRALKLAKALKKKLRLTPSIDKLHTHELSILELDQEIRNGLTRLRSQALCRTTAHRQFLDALWDAAGLPALQAELERRLASLADWQERIAAIVRHMEQERHVQEQEHHDRLSRRVELVLVVLAGASFAAVLAWGNDAFDADRFRAWVELIALIGITAVVVIFVTRRPHTVTAAPAGPIAFRDLAVDHDVELLGRLHRDVLAVSFSADELDDVGSIVRGLRGGGAARTLVSVALGRDDDVLGGVLGEVYEREHVLLLSYLAVRPDLRGRGIGTSLLRYAGPRWYADPAVRLAVGEVHDPRRWPDARDEHPLSRLRFYERFGARVLAVPFVQPALGAGRNRIPDFLLLALHVDPRIEDADAIGSGILARFVRRYYEAAEGVDPAEDPELARLLEAIEQHPTIPLLPIAQYDSVPLLA